MKEFERKIIQELLESSPDIQYSLKDEYHEESVDYSGNGYFLSIKDDLLPLERVILSEPNIEGIIDEVSVGYIAFIENHELMLECYVNGEEFINRRQRNGGFVREKDIKLQ